MQAGLRGSRLGVTISLAFGLALSADPGPARAAPPGAQTFAPPALGLRRPTGPVTTPSQTSGTAIPAQSAQQVQQSINNLAQAARAISAAQALQGQARAAAAAVPTMIPDGIGSGALQPAAGATWQGAALPVQTAGASAARTGVRVTQTTPQAILSWSSFNVGQNTDLVFDQSAGGVSANTWSVLNRVTGSTVPSQVLGSITAPGQVLVINPNGVIFTGTSQVNVGALVASSADIANSAFLSTGVFGPNFACASGSACGPVVVQAGAQIKTNAPVSVSSRGGSVLLLGGSVENDGGIETDSGQTVLAAGGSFSIATGYAPAGSPNAKPTSTTLGSVVTATGSARTGIAGTVTNTGMIGATTGDVTLTGHAVLQAGVIQSTTSVSQRGTIHLLTGPSDPTGSVTLALGSLTAIQTDTSGATAVNSLRAGEITASNALNPQRTGFGNLPDQQGLSRIEITTGGTAVFGGSSLTMATGGQIAVAAAQRVLVQSGALLDVSGSLDVQLPASATVLSVNVQGFQLRDSSNNRSTGNLSSQTLSVNTQQLQLVPASTQAGSGYPSDRYYTAGGLLEVSGELNNVVHTIQEWTTPGGTVTLSSLGSVVTQPGASINLAGGSIRYAPGKVATSWLVGSDGRLYNVNTAPSDITYTGVYQGFVVSDAKWNVSQTYGNPLIAPGTIQQAGFSVGKDGGTLTVSAPTAVLEGGVSAGVVAGEQQSASRAATTDSYAQPQSAIPLPGSFLVGNYQDGTGQNVPYTSAVVIGGGLTGLAGQIDASTAIPAARLNTVWLDTGVLNAAGLGGLAVATAAQLQVTAPLTLAPGGTLTLLSRSTEIDAPITVRSGSVTIGNNATNALSSGNLKGAVVFYLDPSGTGAATDTSGVVLNAGARIDARGIWTNAALDPTNVYGLGLTNGGAVTIDTSQTLTLATGSAIDVSSGGGIVAGGAFRNGQGGSITLIAYDPADTLPPPVASKTPVTLAASLNGVGVSKGGSLSIQAPTVLISDQPVAGLPSSVVVLPTSTFSLGFSSYDVNGYVDATTASGQTVNALTVADGTTLRPVVPVYRANAQTRLAPTGSDPAAVYDTWLPPLYAANPITAKLTQRAGASLSLRSQQTLSQSTGAAGALGSIYLGTGSIVAVDPGQGVTIAGDSQITVLGTIDAPGGQISITNRRQQVGQLFVTLLPNLSIWIGSSARLDVSAQPAVALDQDGRSYGVVPAGGTITLGSAGTSVDDVGSPATTDAYLVLRPGSVLDASGAQAQIDLLAGTSRGSLNGPLPSKVATIASDGGSIALNSESGLYLDGNLRASAGGPGASGGSLTVTFVTPKYVGLFGGFPDTGVAVLRTLVLSQAESPSPLDAGSIPAASSAFSGAAGPFTPGFARISADQIAAGGFASVTLAAGDAIAFDGNVSLQLGRSLSLTAGVLADTSPSGRVVLGAPVVTLGGVTGGSPSTPAGYAGNLGFELSSGSLAAITAPLPSAQSGASDLSVNADLLQIVDQTYVGLAQSFSILGQNGLPTSYRVDLAGFANVELNSTGDVRFLPGAGPAAFRTPGNLTVTAGQVYAATGATGALAGGYSGGDYQLTGTGTYNQASTLTVLRAAGTAPAPPDVAGGTISLFGPRIVQNGIVRSPEGTINIGGSGETTSVTFGAASITSVSAAGQSIPYGGTADGVTYSLGGSAVPTLNPVISVASAVVAAEPGSVIDLRGGGTLTGAEFISGRGGSSDVLTTPLLAVSTSARTVTQPSLSATDSVFAILPGSGSAYAQAPANGASAYAGSTPAAGQTITIGAGVSGLPAGTYTLLPSYYALQPGGFRVEINSAAGTLLAAPIRMTNGSTEISGYTGIANTAIQSVRPVTVTVTPGSVVRTYSTYDEQTYAQFLHAQAALFSTARPMLPADGKTLALAFAVPVTPQPGLSFSGTLLAQPDAGGQAGVVAVGAAGAPLEITGPAQSPTPGYVSLPAASLSALNATTLSIGGYVAPAPSAPLVLSFVNTALYPNGVTVATQGVTLRTGASLAAGQVFLIEPSVNPIPPITLEPGAQISTIGRGAGAFDSSQGYVFSNAGGSVVALSNGTMTFLPPSSGGGVINGSAINVGVCTLSPSCSGTTSLLAGGTIAISTAQGAQFGPSVQFGAQILNLSVASVNFGSDASLANAQAAGLLLPGLSLSQSALGLLLAGNPASGVPALRQLVLTAPQSVNFIGSVALNTIDPATGRSTLDQFTLNTPAIYGAGTASDQVSISTGNFTWNGLQSGTSASFTAPPPIANGPGSGAGSLVVNASRIVFGYTPTDQPNDQVSLNRTTLGFSGVTFNATDRIVANNQGTLSVYQSQSATYGAATGFARSGGNLTLNAPLITGDAAALLNVTAGGAITLGVPAGLSPNTAPPPVSGATLSFTAAGAINDATAIVLPSGALTLTAGGNLTIASGARIDVSGQPVQFYDQTRYGSGGAVKLTSANGSISQQPGASIDISAQGNAAGSLSVAAVNGTVALAGTVAGASVPVAGVSQVFQSGSFDVRANTLDFAALNAALDAGGVTGARSFDVRSGDVTIGGTLKAQSVTVSVDAGSLTVNGTIDASGPQPGAINLAANGNLTVASSALLDAHGTVLQVDSYGAPVTAENRASVQLTVGDLGNAGTGVITIAPGATINLGSPDGVARGLLTLNAPRTTQTGGDIRINAAAPIAIQGAAQIVVNGLWTYSASTVTQALFNTTIDPANRAFVNAALSNTALSGRLSGLTAYGPPFHLRPGDEITSATPTGDLTVSGDIELANDRYGPGATGNGAGEPLALTLRAGGNLNVFGSISDGFVPQALNNGNPDNKGWTLTSGAASNASVILPNALNVSSSAIFGSSFSTSAASLNFAIPVGSNLTLAAGAQIPMTVSLRGAVTLPAGTVVGAAVLGAGGNTLIAAGTVLQAPVALPAGAMISAGNVLPVALPINASTANRATWLPAGAPLNVFSGSSVSIGTAAGTTFTLPAGAVIPSGARLVSAIPGNPLSLRPSGDSAGDQGVIFEVARLLPPGSQSASLQLTAGAFTGAANPSVVQPASQLAAAGITGSVTLSDPHVQTSGAGSVIRAGSVLRTGTGSLTIEAGGSFVEGSPYGVYTAGTQTTLGSADAAYNLPRSAATTRSRLILTTLGTRASPYEGFVNGSATSTYQANYPDGGGDLVLAAQGDVNGYDLAPIFSQITVDYGQTGNWLWRQGGNGQAASWWVNFGTYVLPLSSTYVPNSNPTLVGFTGIGTLGGGNLTVAAGGNAGVNAIVGAGQTQSQGLILAVGSTGRVVNGQLQQQGGGNLTLRVAGALNDASSSGSNPALYGVVTDLRGSINISAGSIGQIVQSFGQSAGSSDPRAPAPTAANQATWFGGPLLVPGDSTAVLQSRRDLVIQSVVDPGFIQTEGLVTQTAGTAAPGATAFSLWTSGTSVTLTAAGGNLAPETLNYSVNGVSAATIYPPTLKATTLSGNIYEGLSATSSNSTTGVLELAPSPTGQLELLAKGSIHGDTFDQGGTLSFDLSGASVAPGSLPSPLYPDFRSGSMLKAGFSLFDFEPNTATGTLHAADPAPARIYAASGDVVNVLTGDTLTLNTTGLQQLIAAKPVSIYAGNDIVGSGTPPTSPRIDGSTQNLYASGLFLNNNPSDISSVIAGRDILYLNARIAGPGTLYVQAGRNIFEGAQGQTESTGRLNSQTGGAGIVEIAGVGAAGPDYARFATAYLDPASTAAGAQIYSSELLTFLRQTYGYTGPASGALQAFDALPETTQAVFLLPIYFDELRASGREFTNPASVRYKSYARGRAAIASLFPSSGANGQPITYSGGITLFPAANTSTPGSLLRTDHGGSISVLAPGGQVLLGTDSLQTRGGEGILTEGQGDIGVYALGSVLLGQSRIFTTFGGGITIWSATGDVNAGRGANTTQTFSPAQTLYDPYGNVTLSPNVATTGAGIATLASIPGVPAGDVDLIAPLGTIDAGEAGIRVSGNANLAALTVVNASNVQVGGKSTGLPTVVVPNVSAISAASAASAAASQAARQASQQQASAAQDRPSTITVEVSGYDQ